MRFVKGFAGSGILLSCLLFANPPKTYSQNTLTIPPYHWVQSYYWEWQLRHPAAALFPGAQPFTFAEITPAVRAAAAQTPFEVFLAGKIAAEWKRLRTGSRSPAMSLGVRVHERAGKIRDGLRSRAVLSLLTHVRFSERFHIFNATTLDQNLGDDPEYLGKRWRGFTAIGEQAFAYLQLGKFSAKFGRDYVRWGRAQDAALTVSDASRPFDLLQLQFRTARLQFTYFASKLNSVALSDSSAARLQTPFAHRYMSAGRVEFANRRHTLQIGLTQTVLYGGARGFEWYYLNPFIIYHGEQLNELQELRANTMGAIDLVWYPRRGAELYGQLLIDDIQIERTGPGDLEPNEIGFILGFQIAGPLSGLRGTTLGLEYTRVTNRTYNTLPEAEKYVHRNKPIGHFLGNDFDRWLLHGRSYLGHDLLLSVSAEFRRHGEGRVNAPFDQPWLAFTVEEGYSEPFPTGVVEKSTLLDFELRWHPKAAFFAAVAGKWMHAENYGNVAGVRLDRFEIFVKMWWELQRFWGI